MIRKLFLSALALVMLLSLAAVQACGGQAESLPAPEMTPISIDPCHMTECQVNQVILNTGYNQSAGALYNVGEADGYWQLVETPDPGVSVNSPAWVIGEYTMPGYITPSWDTLPDSQWISAYNFPGWTTNNEEIYLNQNNVTCNNSQPYKLPYTFERSFCTCENMSIRINLSLLVDNTACVYFDGTLIGSQPDNTVNSFNFFYNAKVINEVRTVSPGVHRLTIKVRNLSGFAMGLDVQGTVRSESPQGASLFLKAACCDPTGQICGRKINDLNCNGSNDNTADNPSIEPGLLGWTIAVTNTQTGATTTTTTDVHGCYCFGNLSPGTYTVSEQAQSGWTQTIPGGAGTYTVTLTAGQVIQDIDFGNCRSGSSACNCSTWSPITVTWDGALPEQNISSCGDTVFIPSMYSGTNISIISSTNCSPGCNTSYNWSVTKTSGSSEGPWYGTGLPASFAPTSHGIFTVVLNASCGNTSCPPCTLTIQINKVELMRPTPTPTPTPTSACNCSTWSPVTITWNSTSAGKQAISCGNLVTIPWIYVDPVMPWSVNSSVNCSTGCNVSYNWSLVILSSPDTSAKVGGGSSGIYLPITMYPQFPGLFKVVINASCDGTTCPPCEIHVNMSESGAVPY